MTKPTPKEIVNEALRALSNNWDNASEYYRRTEKTTAILRALEAAGYRIVGPEVTEEMKVAAVFAGEKDIRTDVFRAMIAAATKWGGE